MTFRATWFDGLDEIACDNFDDLMEAQDYVLEHFALYQQQFGIDRVRVCNGNFVYFSLERAPNSQNFAHTPARSARCESFHPGIHVSIVANDGPETRARIDWPSNQAETGVPDPQTTLLQECLKRRVDPSNGKLVRRKA